VPHPADLGVVEAASALRSGQLSSEELVASCLDRISARDPGFGAFIRVYDTEALLAARQADARRAAGVAGPLEGIPVALKDVVGVAGLPLTADSALLEGNFPTADATVWARLRSAGMVLVGHLHCGELAYGHWGVNPWGASISPGGSSSGSGVALAARLVPATIGTDARGSIRMPAAFTGVTAVKPTFGLVSVAGCIPITFSYDTVGPMARSAADCAAMLEVMAGRDVGDRLTHSQPVGSHYAVAARPGNRPLSGVRIGVPELGDRLSPGVGAVLDRFVDELAELGAERVSFSWPRSPLEQSGDDELGDFVHILGAEAAAIHQQFAGREHLYREEFRRLFLPVMGRSSNAGDYLRAQSARGELVETWSTLFTDLGLDAALHPACAGEAYGADAEVSPRVMRQLMFGVWNDTGFPVVSLPAGLSPSDGSPVGMQLVGLPFTEQLLLQVAVDIQAATDYHSACPAGLDEAPRYVPPPRHETGPQPPFVVVRSPFDALVPEAPWVDP
jgi:aspartyl-tRNA(Asn)/glutamyl-tRNA(Gln) amidotransferase subunit A